MCIHQISREGLAPPLRSHAGGRKGGQTARGIPAMISLAPKGESCRLYLLPGVARRAGRTSKLAYKEAEDGYAEGTYTGVAMVAGHLLSLLPHLRVLLLRRLFFSVDRERLCSRHGFRGRARPCSRHAFRDERRMKGPGHFLLPLANLDVLEGPFQPPARSSIRRRRSSSSILFRSDNEGPLGFGGTKGTSGRKT